MLAALVALGMGFVQAGSKPPVAQVKDYRGAPALFINGVHQPATSYMTYAPAGRNFKTMGEAGVHLYSFSATPTESSYGLAPLCWTGPEDFDYTNMDDRSHLLLTNDPDALFFPRVYLGTPAWWAQAHPEALVQYSPAEGAPQVFLLNDRQRVASWASDRWREDTAEALRKFIRHVERSDYAENVVGYHLASGTTEEWMQWGSNEDRWADYSPVNAARFRAWLTEKYHSDAGLHAAWNDPTATLDSVAIPSRVARAAGEFGFFRDPAKAQASIDYVLYNSWLVADTIRYFARVVKDETHHERLVGVFYGYVLQLAGEQREQNSGHLALNEVLSCRDVDFITSPSSYAFRQLGAGFPHAMSLVDSVKAHHKLWFDENDIRTWLTPDVKPGEFGKTATYEESLLAQQREFAWVLTQRLGMWWFDMGGGWYDDPRMLSEIGKMQRIAESCRDADGSAAAEIAFVVDGTSSAYLKPGNPYSGDALIRQLPELGRVGAPFATVHLADLGCLPAYKMYVFPNCFAPSVEQRRAIETIRRKGAAIVWIGPAGLYRDGKLEPSAMSDLVGLPLELRPASGPWRVQPTPAAMEWGWKTAAPFGTGRSGSVAIATPSSGVVVLGVLEGTAEPALVADDRNGIRVFSSIPGLPAGLLRTVAQKAGVHRYIDTEDIVWASRDLLAVSVNQAGPRTIRLPRPCIVTDLWSGQTVARDADHFVVDIPERGTALFRLSASGIQSSERNGHVDLSENGVPILRYDPGVTVVPEGIGPEYARGDYVSRLYGLDGELLTEDYPTDHSHHRAVNWSWATIRWNGEMRDLFAVRGIWARPDGKPEVRADAVSTSIEAKSVWKWDDTTPVVGESVTIRVFPRTNQGRVIDFEINLTALVEDLEFCGRLEAGYSGFNVRMAKGQGQQIVLHDDQPEANPRRSWADYSAEFPAGKGRSGLAILQSESNPLYPSEWRKYPELNFFQPAYPGGKLIPMLKDKTITLRYRLWIHHGAAGEQTLADQWDTYNRSPQLKER